MPKRRNRSTLAKKPSLLFTESPVNVQNNVPSPVFCARHPPTAKSVPISELQDLSWVSPQFKPTYNSGGRRVTRQRRKSKSSLHPLTNKENTWHGPGQLIDPRIKYKSLKFLGDQTSLPSFDEDLHISVDSDTGPEDNNCSCCLGRNVVNHYCNGNDAKVTRYHELPSCSCPQTTYLGGNNKKHNQQQSTADNSSNSDKINESSEIDFTDLRKNVLQKAPVKKLFSSNLSPGTGMYRDDVQTPLVGTIEQISETETATLAERVSEPETVGETSSDADTSPVLRRSLRLVALRNLWSNSQTPKKTNFNILVPDTPEDEYGWSIRKRRQRKHAHNN